jgi:hypothetical protein
MIYVFNSIVGERRTLLLMKYKTNDTFFLWDVDMLQLNSYSFHTMASDLDLGNHHLSRCKSCEHQMLQPIACSSLKNVSPMCNPYTKRLPRPSHSTFLPGTPSRP